MKKIKSWLTSKTARASAVLALAAVSLCGSAFAAVEGVESSSETVMTAMQTGFQGFADDALKMIAIIVPIALGVAGVVWLVRKALGWFKSMSK